MPALSSADTPSPAPDALDALAAALAYRFRDDRLLRTAVTHRSYLNEVTVADTTDNERLEYLGDAFLDLVAAEHLYRRLPMAQEGVLTALRAALVCKPTLARFARELDLGRYVRLGRGEAAAGGRDRAGILGDAFEAVVGAVYLDGGTGAARRLVLRFLAPEAEAVLAAQAMQDAKSAFQEQIQRRWHVTPAYVTVAEEGPHHERSFVVEVRVNGEVWGSGMGRNKAEAARQAAEVALARLAVRSATAAGAEAAADV